MHLTQIAILAAAGFVAGAMNAIAGGGTILTFPALIFAGLPPKLANATSTLALLPASLSGAAGFRQNLPGVWHWVRRFALVSLLGGLIGGVLLTLTPAKVFDWLVPILILFATVLFTARPFFARLFRLAVEHEHQAPPSAEWLAGAICFQFFVAVYGGYFGAGIGILMLASLGMLGIGDLHEMNAVKNVLGFLINLVAAVYFVWKGMIDWPAAGVMAAASVVGGYAGAHYSQKVPQRAVRHLITGIGLLLTVVMFSQKFAKH
jgi:uncharacterized membrane protein YfcA